MRCHAIRVFLILPPAHIHDQLADKAGASLNIFLSDRVVPFQFHAFVFD